MTPLRLSEAANIALHACAILARSVGRMSSGELARMTGFSPSHTAKVLQGLTRSGILRSTRGASGGFELADEPGSLDLLRLVETVEGPLGPGGCLLGSPVCGRESCLLSDVSAETAALVAERLGGVTLEEFASEMRLPPR